MNKRAPNMPARKKKTKQTHLEAPLHPHTRRPGEELIQNLGLFRTNKHYKQSHLKTMVNAQYTGMVLLNPQALSPWLLVLLGEQLEDSGSPLRRNR
jgi:hypothetical protein